MRVVVRHQIGVLAANMASMRPQFRTEATRIVRANAEKGNELAKEFAKERSGPHGLHYHKRLHAEMLTATSAEFGPDGVPKSEFVGAGYRTVGVNMDLLDAADIIGPKFADDVIDAADRLFW